MADKDDPGDVIASDAHKSGDDQITLTDPNDDGTPATPEQLDAALERETKAIEQDADPGEFPVIDTAALRSHFEGARSVVGINVLRLCSFYDKCAEQYRRGRL